MAKSGPQKTNSAAPSTDPAVSKAAAVEVDSTASDVSLEAAKPQEKALVTPNWEHFPNPARLHFGCLNEQSTRVTDFADDSGGFPWHVVTSDPDVFISKLEKHLEEKLRPAATLLSEKIGDPDDSEEIDAELEAVSHSILEAMNGEDIASDLEGLDGVVRQYRDEKTKKGFKPLVDEVLNIISDMAEIAEDMAKEAEGRWPDVYMNDIYPLDCTDSEAVEFAGNLVNHTCMRVIQDETTEDYFLLMAGCGMDLTDHVVEAYCRCGHVPPFAYAKALMEGMGRTYGQEIASGKLDPVEVERKLGLMLACERSLDAVLGQAQRAMDRVTTQLEISGWK